MTPVYDYGKWHRCLFSSSLYIVTGENIVSQQGKNENKTPGALRLPHM